MRKYLSYVILGGILILAGLIVGVPATVETVQHQAMEGRSETVTGTVTGSHTRTTHSRRGGTRHTYCPIYTYTAGDGRDRTLIDENDCSSSSVGVHRGETAPVSYDPNNPQAAFVNTPHTATSLATKIIFGVLLLAGGITAIVVTAAVSRRSQRTPVPAGPIYPPVGYGQPQYGQPQYGQPQYSQQPYGQPQYGQPHQYQQPPYSQPHYGHPQPGHTAPPYGQQYGYPPYQQQHPSPPPQQQQQQQQQQPYPPQQYLPQPQPYPPRQP